MRWRPGRVGAWLVTAGLLCYLFWKIPLPDIARAFGNAAGWTVPVAALLLLAIYTADSLAMWKTFGWFVARLPLREVMIIRGATYLLALVNYALGQGAIVYFVNRTRGVPVARGTATVLLIMGINVLVLLFMSTAGVAIGAETKPELIPVIKAGYVGLAIYLVAVVTKPRWLTERPIFDVLLTAGLRGHLKALAARVPHVLSLVLFTTTSLYAVGVPVPLSQALMCLPVVYLAALVSVQGLGTTQMAMLFFFARYAPGDRASQEAKVFAASLAGQALAMAVQASISLVCLRSQIARELKQVPVPS